MEITIEQQESTDFDWFCVDAENHIGHFTTAGYKLLPTSVAHSTEELAIVTNFFTRELSNRSAYSVEESVAHEGSRYLHSFVSMASRGLFSYDIASHLSADARYFRVATPESPIKLDQLPEEIRTILEKTHWSGEPFSRLEVLPYEQTLTI